MANNTLEVDLVVNDKTASNILDGFNKKLQETEKGINDTGKNSQFAKEFGKQFDDLEKRIANTTKNLTEFSKTRLDSGNIGNLTKETVKAQEKSKLLFDTVQNLKTALASTPKTDKGLIKIFTDDLQRAEKEADGLNRKLQSVSKSDNSGNSANADSGNQKLGRLRGFGAIFRGVGSPVNESELNAVSAVAEHLGITLDGIEAAIGGISTGFLATAGVVGVAGVAIVKYSQSVREEAERRLKVEENLSVEYGKQQTEIKGVLDNYKKLKDAIATDSSFDRFQSGFKQIPDAVLRERQATLENLIRLNPKGENSQTYQNQALSIEKYLYNAPNDRQKTADEAFQKRGEEFIKSQENAAKFREEKQKAFNESVKQGKEKVKELGKTYESVFDSLTAKSGANNPFVSLFTEGDKELRKLHENTKGLPKDLISTFEKLQEKQNAAALFDTRLNTQLSAFDLKNQAEDFRTAKPATNALNEQLQYGVNSKNLLRLIKEADFYAKDFNPNNPKDFDKSRFTFAELDRFGEVAGNQRKGESRDAFRKRQEEAVQSGIKIQDSITEVKRLADTNLKGSGIYGADLVANEILKNIPTKEELLNQLKSPYIGTREDAQFLLNSQSKALHIKKEFEDQSFKDSLESRGRISQRIDEKIGIINKSASNYADNSLEAQSARRQLIAITQGLNPSELTGYQRDQAASSREREAIRQENAEKEAIEQRAISNQLQTQVVEQLTKLVSIAEKEGLKGIDKLLVEIVDKNNIANVGQVKTPSPKDTAKAMNGTFYDEYQKQ